MPIFIQKIRNKEKYHEQANKKEVSPGNRERNDSPSATAWESPLLSSILGPYYFFHIKSINGTYRRRLLVNRYRTSSFNNKANALVLLLHRKSELTNNNITITGQARSDANITAFSPY